MEKIGVCTYKDLVSAQSWNGFIFHVERDGFWIRFWSTFLKLDFIGSKFAVFVFVEELYHFSMSKF